ncbi:MAG TPA: SBBP repeat-containing protein, partial [Acidobacteriota bacterium]
AKFGGGDTDGFWMIVNNAGNKILFSTYLGGNNTDSVDSLFVDPVSGKVYASGGTFSTNFPKPSSSSSALNPNVDNCKAWFLFFLELEAFHYAVFRDEFDIIEAQFSFDCNSRFTTLLIFEKLIQLINAGFLAATTNQGIVSGGLDAHLVARDLNLNVINAFTYGGSGAEYANAITRDSKGRIYIAGDTTSTDLPLMNPVQTVNRGRQDGYIAMFDQNLQLLFSTYLGGTGFDSIHDIKVDAKGNIYVTGFTDSNNLRTTPHAFQKSRKGPPFSNDAFIFKITPVAP